MEFFRSGRQISASKIARPGHDCVWNANICINEKNQGIKIWFGDLDLTDDMIDLQNYANFIGKDLYILREKDARFMNEHSPLLERAVTIVRKQ